VLLGQGDGRFTNLAEYNTDTNASNVSIAVADVTNDGNLDIICHALATLAVLPGTGNGTFGAPILSGNSTPSQTDTLVADFTGDGDLDVVAVIRTGGEDFGSGDLRLEEGAGNGTFTLVQTRSFDGNPGGAVVANLNGDARPDVAVTGTRGSNGGRTGLRVSLNANGSLGPIVFYAFPPFPFGDLDAADFDLDGDVDLAGTGLASLAVALNDGSGTFTGVAEFIASGGTRLAGDFTGDGKPDVLVLLQTNLPMLALYVNTTS
jgi:hypothetical protein